MVREADEPGLPSRQVSASPAEQQRADAAIHVAPATACLRLN